MSNDTHETAPTGAAVLTVVAQQGFRPLGFPIASWAFAFRIWIAALLALYVSFWLQLEAPSSSLLSVAILAEQTRGQALEKAGFRIIATIVGIMASLVIVALFSQTRDLLLVALAGWLGLCVYVSGLFDGNRAYAGVLSGYTVAFIAVQQLDNPEHVFESSMARGAAICVGIISITIVNDLLLAPHHHPKLLIQLTDIHRRVREHAIKILRGEAVEDIASAGLIGEIAALRPEISGLAVESSDGHMKAAAAHNAAAALVTEIHAARMLNALPVIADETTSRAIASTLDRIEGAVSSDAPKRQLNTETKDSKSVAFRWVLLALLRRDEQVRMNLSSLRCGDRPRWHWRTIIFRSHQNAVESGIRAAIWFLLAEVFFVYAGWPAADVSLSLVAVVIGLGAVTPNPRLTTAVALIASPIAGMLAGILEFYVLDGVADFPLLAIALAPYVIGASLLIASADRRVSSFGRLMLVFTSSTLAPSNPQTYDPQSYTFTFLFTCVACGLLLAIQCLVPPLSGERRIRRLLASAFHDFGRILTRHPRCRPEEEMFRDAVRIGQLMTAGGADPKGAGSIKKILACFDRSSIIRLCNDELGRVAGNGSREAADAAKVALISGNPEVLRETSRALHEAYPADRTVAELCSALVVASYLIVATSALGANAETAK
jgi:uncharacterized membrane protein YccC